MSGEVKTTGRERAQRRLMDHLAWCARAYLKTPTFGPSRQVRRRVEFKKAKAAARLAASAKAVVLQRRGAA